MTQVILLSKYMHTDLQNLVTSTKHFLPKRMLFKNHCLDLYKLPVTNCSSTYKNKFKYRYPDRVLVGKPEGKRPLGRPRCRWEDNIKMDVQEVGGGREDWMEVAQDRDGWWALVGTVRNFRAPEMRGIS
jgi:hypothetical protein